MHLLPAPVFSAVVVGSDTTNLVINLIILVLVLVVAFWIIGKMAAPDPIGTILRVLIGLLGLLWLLNLIGFVGGHQFFIYHN